jgi:hypothetical protein
MIHFALLLLAVPTSSDARFHPAGADVYVELPDVKATCAAYAEAPLVKTLRDPAIARIVEAAKAVGPDLGAMFAGFLPTPDPARPDDRFWPWSALTTASMSLSGLDAIAPETTPWTERASGWIVLDFADAAAATLALGAIGATAGVKTAAASEHAPDESAAPRDGSKSAPEHADAKGAPNRVGSSGTATAGGEAKLDATLSIDGVDAAVVRHELDLFGNKVTFWIAQSGARIVGGIGRAQPQELVARLAKPETSFLAQRARLVDDKGLQAPCGTVIARAWSDLERLPIPAAASEALGPELVDLAMAELAPFVGQRGVHRLQLCKDQFVWESLVEHTGPAKALDDLYGAAPIPASTARFVPKDAVGAWLLCIQPAQVEALMERVLAQVTTPSAQPADAAAAKTTPPGTSTGATTPSSVAAQDMPAVHPSAALGGSAAIFLMPVTPSMGGGGFTPNTQVVLELKDATAFQSAFEAWIAHVRALDPTLKVEDKPYHKRPAYTFTRGAAGADEKSAGAALHPTLVIMTDRVFIATTRQYAQSEVRRIEAATGEESNASMAGAISPDAFEASFMDWGKLVGKLYDLARGFIPLMMQGSKTTFDVSQLPTSAELFRFIQPSTTTTARVDGKLYKRSVTSLGPETPLALAALSIAATSQFAGKSGMVAATQVREDGADGTVTRGNVVGADGKPVAGKDKAAGSGSNTSTEGSRKESNELTATTSALRDVKTGLAVYRSQFGRVPDTLDDLLKGTDAFPNGFLDGGAVPKDGWNHALVYAVREKGAKFDLRSCGPNGVDDHGGGDDVSAP